MKFYRICFNNVRGISPSILDESLPSFFKDSGYNHDWIPFMILSGSLAKIKQLCEKTMGSFTPSFLVKLLVELVA